AAAVVDDAETAVGEERHLDLGAIAREGFVDGVVDDLVHQVVQTALTGRADVHAGPLAYRLETLEDGDRRCVVGHGSVVPPCLTALAVWHCHDHTPRQAA